MGKIDAAFQKSGMLRCKKSSKILLEAYIEKRTENPYFSFTLSKYSTNMTFSDKQKHKNCLWACQWSFRGHIQNILFIECRWRNSLGKRHFFSETWNFSIFIAKVAAVAQTKNNFLIKVIKWKCDYPFRLMEHFRCP